MALSYTRPAPSMDHSPAPQRPTDQFLTRVDENALDAAAGTGRDVNCDESAAWGFTIKDTLLSEFAVDESLVSNFAINEAFQRYQSGVDLYLVPMTRVALEDVLRRYARDALHNTISLSRFKIAFGNGSYGRILQLLYDSISSYLDEVHNVEFLLDMHCARHVPMNDLGSSSALRWIKIK